MLISVEEYPNQMSIWLSGPEEDDDKQRLLALAEQIKHSDVERCVFNLSEKDALNSREIGMLLYVSDTVLLAGKNVEFHGLQEAARRQLHKESAGSCGVLHQKGPYINEQGRGA